MFLRMFVHFVAGEEDIIDFSYLRKIAVRWWGTFYSYSLVFPRIWLSCSSAENGEINVWILQNQINKKLHFYCYVYIFSMWNQPCFTVELFWLCNKNMLLSHKNLEEMNKLILSDPQISLRNGKGDKINI